MSPCGASVEALPARRGERLVLLDELRGLAIVLMVAFHACYDIHFIFGYSLDWFAGPFGTAWERIVAWLFVGIAGSSAALSHNNMRRAAKLALVAALITLVTWLVRIDIPIWFGVIHCLALCTFLFALFGRALKGVPPCVGLSISLLIALVTSSIWEGQITLLPGLSISLPSELYTFDTLAFLGFPGPHFSSGDYFPLLPYLFVYLAGYFALRVALDKRSTPPRCFTTPHSAALSWLGRHSLPIYLIHQVALLAILSAWFYLTL